MSTPNSSQDIPFEQAVSELETLVNEMEQGDLPLDQALKKFERGITLAKVSQQALKEAEQRVKILMNQNEEDVLVDFDPEQSTL